MRSCGKSTVERDRPHIGTRVACWILKSANTLSEYVILFAFPLQQWFLERASVSRYTCIDCLVKFAVVRSVAVKLQGYFDIWVDFV
jgi:hypothetical protein